MVDHEGARPRSKLSRFLQPVLLGASLGLALWLVGVQGPGHPVPGSPATPNASGPPVLTRSCTPQEMAFDGAIKDCALPMAPIGTCTVSGNPTPCGAPSGSPIACTGLGSSSGSFGISLTLRGATKTIYELSLAVTHGYHGAGTYVTSPSPNPAAGPPQAEITIRIADSSTHRFWEAVSGTIDIAQSGQAGSATANMRATSGSQAPGSADAFLLDGPWSCG